MGEERAFRRRGAGRAQLDVPLTRGDQTPGAGNGPAPGSHVPVMLEEIRELLSPALADREAVCVDATLGLGGHAEALLRDHPRLVLVGLDRDSDALRRTRERLAPFADRIRLVHTGYRDISVVLDDLGYARVDAVLFDLGVSSLQLDLPERGFSYAKDAPLDMRMDTTTGTPAETIVNEYSAAELARVLKQYGEERFASRIAAAIVRERARERLTSSRRLAAIVQDAIPVPARRTGGHPAKRTFQALRIEVNGELEELTEALPAAVAALRVGGRVAVLAYHSLEDRIVKQTLATGARSSAPLDLPIEPPGTEPRLQLLTRGAARPGDGEVAVNPRAASARLRAAERIREAA